MTERIGQQLGNYRLISLLGRGGFAEVYLGEHIYLKTQAAVKVLQTRLASPDDLESFLTEARTIAGLSHPNIVRVMDFGVDSETPFLVMDYAPNGTLRQRHPRGTPLPLPTIVTYVKQLAAALQDAHNEKLVHRDVKPENMLLGRRNDVLLSDFGIALITQSSRYQSTQEVVGTVAYMSPEQIQGKPRPASDQYSLAITVYEWLSGDRPFHGSFTELCTQHLFAPPAPLREKVPTVPPDVVHVVMMALAKDPKQRFANVQAFANALEQASQPALPKVVIPPVQPQRVVRPSAQYASPPPLASTQLASALPRSATEPSPQQIQTPSTSSVEKANVWSIGKRQIVAMLIGVILFAVLGWLGGLYSASPSYSQHIVTGITLLGIAEVTPLFFGAFFGPWAGFFTGGAGFFIGFYILSYVFDAIRGFSNSFISNYQHGGWQFTIAIALIGFVAGLSIFKTKGRYNNLRAIGIAEGFSALGIVVSMILLVITLYFSSSIIPYILLYSLPGLVLLPILLPIYDKIAYRKQRA